MMLSMTGAYINTAAVLCRGSVGILSGNRLQTKMKELGLQGLGLLGDCGLLTVKGILERFAAIPFSRCPSGGRRVGRSMSRNILMAIDTVQHDCISSNLLS